jgi:hypothetical protein
MDGGWGWEGNGLVPAARCGHSFLVFHNSFTFDFSLPLSSVCFGEETGGRESDFSDWNDGNNPFFTYLSLIWFTLTLIGVLVLVLPCVEIWTFVNYENYSRPMNKLLLQVELTQHMPNSMDADFSQFYLVI